MRSYRKKHNGRNALPHASDSDEYDSDDDDTESEDDSESEDDGNYIVIVYRVLFCKQVTCIIE